MSRQSSAPSRTLTLTEELERIEQSITLTLQEIDHNFSKAHRIVTTSIIPIVEQYGQHSQNVWEGSKFWKQFFEASANVSLSGYEEPVADDDPTYTGHSVEDSSVQTPPTTTLREGEEDVGEDEFEESEESSMMDSPSNATGVHSTPTIAGSAAKRTRSPPASRSRTNLPTRLRQASEEPSTPRGQKATDGELLDSSPFEPPSALQPTTAQRSHHDPLLHRVLDKTYRIQATPHTARRHRSPKKEQGTPVTHTTRSVAFDSSPQSSPAMPAPQLRADFFSPAPPSAKKTSRLPRTPGVPLRSPAPRMTSTGKPISRQPVDPQKLLQRTPALWDSDDEEDETDAFGISPPKTMQFAIPSGRLMQTPAREASRRIVEDLLTEAGAEGTEEIEGLDDGEAPSPTVVRGIEDDSTF